LWVCRPDSPAGIGGSESIGTALIDPGNRGRTNATSA
jgi:hypothetical protein